MSILFYSNKVKIGKQAGKCYFYTGLKKPVQTGLAISGHLIYILILIDV